MVKMFALLLKIIFKLICVPISIIISPVLFLLFLGVVIDNDEPFEESFCKEFKLLTDSFIEYLISIKNDICKLKSL